MRSIPDHCQPYKKTPVFTQDTIPAGLLKAHQTKAGTWGKIVIMEGKLAYRVLQAPAENHVLNPRQPGVVEPEVLHEVQPEGEVKFYVEFYR